MTSSVYHVFARLLITFFSTGRVFLVFSQFQNMASNTEDINEFHEVSESNNKFVHTFYSNVSTEIGDNIVCSPLSAHVLLSLITYGAKGRTEEELRNGLHLPGRNSAVQEGFKHLISNINNITNAELILANNIYIQDDLKLIDDFLLVSSEFFYSDTPRVDFRDAVVSAKQINSWVEEKTNKRITNLMSPDNIDESTKLVLVNAIYFKGIWAHKFDPKLTENRPFYITKDTKRHVPMMFKKFKYPHAIVEELNAKVIEIPYLNEELSMVIILPNEIKGLQHVENNFDMRSIKNIKWRSNDIELYLPRFEIETTINLVETLKEMGMRTMFSHAADFSGIAQSPMHVSDVLQKAFIKVNEEGSEAAAATGVQMRLRRMVDPPETFQVDHPFMFAIHHKPSNIPIFVGSVRDIKIFPEKDEL